MAKEQGAPESIVRPPVVVVLGHVDHGKTTLLDFIRKANVAAGEAGGITQSIGAYEITHNSKRITFIDTPGHEAFSKMRARGAKVADIAILVVAVDDGVQPQTKEAIKIIRAAEIPFVVAITKMDKEGMDDSRVKNELTAEGVLLEGYGGNVSVQGVSGKTGAGIPELLDTILLTAELSDFRCDTSRAGEGVILEAKIDGRRGIVATGIVKDGTIRVGEKLAAGSAVGKVKGLENFLGERIREATPSSPVRISGFDELPAIGDKFVVGATFIQEPKERGAAAKAVVAGGPEKGDVLTLILKADVAGSLECLSQIIKALPAPHGVSVKVFSEAVGEITDGDVKLAVSVGGTVIGFRVKPTKPASQLAEVHDVAIVASDIVYELVKAVEERFKSLGHAQVKAEMEILAIFGKKGPPPRLFDV